MCPSLKHINFCCLNVPKSVIKTDVRPFFTVDV